MCFEVSRCRRLVRVKHKTLIVLFTVSVLWYLTFTLCLLYGKISIVPTLLDSRSSISDNNSRQDSFLDTFSHVGSSCKEKTHFVFIKGMKCATSTLLGVFYRFGYTRNLSFVSPLRNRLYLNWPYTMTKRDFRPSSRGYNILTDHSVFSETVMGEIMPADTIYISIVREPWAHVLSIFQYFKIHLVAGVPQNVTNPVVEYFTHVEKYESHYASPLNKERLFCYPAGFSFTRNLMSHCHGMPLGFPPGTKDISNDPDAVDQYLKHLDKKFGLIMIVEYFYESLILLRRLMCWAFRDILFIRANVARYDFDVTKIDPHVVDIYRNWSSIDYRLFHYFNQTLWQRISEQGSLFYEEVAEFKIVESQVSAYCQSVYRLGKLPQYPANVSLLVVSKSSWTGQFSLTPSDCWMLGPDPYHLLHVVQQENDVKEATLLAEHTKLPDNRTASEKSVC